MDQPPRMSAYALTDPGRVRGANEDCVYASADEGLLIVADGMGGHAGGGAASAIAVRTIAEILRGALPDRPNTLSAYAPYLLRNAVRQADEAIRERAAADPALAGMGTTVIAALCRPEGFALAHVGDSRAYLLQADRFQQITRDHSLVGRMVEAGAISKEEARRHDLRNVITRCLGGLSNSEPDLLMLPWSSGDVLMLCTDGLTTMLEDAEMETVLRSSAGDFPACARQLISMANERGGTDNISVVLGRWEGSGQ